MFNQKQTNTKALIKAQDDIEALMNNFETLDFAFTVDGVTATVKGDLSLSNIESSENVAPETLLKASIGAVAVAKKERSVSLVRIRNKILKSFKFDIKALIPEIAKAVAHLDEIQASK